MCKIVKFTIDINEEWKPIDGWPYQVSTLGNVRNAAGKIIRQWDHNGNRYACLRVTLKDKGRKHNARVHRLVAAAFVPNRHGKPEVNHKDRNSFNNAAENLEWATRAEQEQHKRASKSNDYLIARLQRLNGKHDYY